MLDTKPRQRVNVNKSQKKKVTGTFIVRNDRGLHTRPSAELVKCASSFESEVKITHRTGRNQKMEANAKSLLGILMLAAAKGSKIQVEATGKDAEKAVNTILSLADQNFHMHY